MDDKQKCDIRFASEIEWRQILFSKVSAIEEKLAQNMAWTLVFRVIGGGLVGTGFALLVAYIEFRLK